MERRASLVRDKAAQAVSSEEKAPQRGLGLRKAEQAVALARRALNEAEIGGWSAEQEEQRQSVFSNPADLPVQPNNLKDVLGGEGNKGGDAAAAKDAAGKEVAISDQPAPFKSLAVAGFQVDAATRWKRAFLWYQAGGFMDKLVSRIPRLHEPYHPPVWMASGTCHLLCATVYRSAIHPLAPWSSLREIVAAPDGGTLSVDWFKGFMGPVPHTVHLPPHTPIVLVLHAFAGNSKESYCITAMRAAAKKGWRAASMNYRGCGDTPLTSPRPFSVAASIDVYTVVTSIKKKFPGAPIFMIGFSIGAYTLTKYLAEVDSGQLPADGKLTGAMCCGSGFDYKAEMDKISKPGVKVIDFDWIERLYWEMYLSQFKDALKGAPGIDWLGVKKAKTVPEMEACFIPATWGFKDMDEYYESFNALKLIHLIRTPTLFFSAEDDPFLDMAAAPIRQVQQTPFAAFALTKEGGHCGHLVRLGWTRGLSMIDKVMQDMYEAILRLTPEEKADLDRQYEEWRAGHPFNESSKVMTQLSQMLSMREQGAEPAVPAQPTVKA